MKNIIFNYKKVFFLLSFGHIIRREAVENILLTLNCIKLGRDRQRNDAEWSKMVTWMNIINRIDPDYQGVRSVEKY